MKYQIRNTIFAACLVLPLCLATAQDDEKGKGKDRPGPGGPGGPDRPGGPGFQAPNFADIDADKSGDIDKEEWVAFQVKMAQERAENSFKFLAGDDEKISEEELKKMAQHRGPGDRKGPGEGDRPKGKGKGPDGDANKPKRPAVEE